MDNAAQPKRRLIADPLSTSTMVGVAAIIFSAVYLLSDVLEVAQGGFSTLRLSFTYAGEAAIPLFVLGLYAVQRPRVGRLGLMGAVAYAYSYVFFTATVVYAIVAGTPNYHDLSGVFGGWMVVHGAIMLVGGLAFGVAVIRAGMLPRWTGLCLMVGVVLVVAASDLPNLARAVAAALPAAAFAGMGWAMVTRNPRLAGSVEPGRLQLRAHDGQHLTPEPDQSRRELGTSLH